MSIIFKGIALLEVGVCELKKKNEEKVIPAMVCLSAQSSGTARPIRMKIPQIVGYDSEWKMKNTFGVNRYR